MGIALKQSTASQEIPLGYFLDSTDGNTAETGLTISNTDIKIWKNGATTLADKNSGGATHISGGIYYCTLDATDTNTVGPLVIFIHESGALTVRLECHVYEEAIYDAFFGSGAVAFSTAAALATAQADLDIITGASGVNLLSATQASIDAIEADTNELQGDWTNAGRLDTILDAVATQASVDTVDGIVDAILLDTAEIGAAGAGLTAVPWNASWDAEVQSECEDALNVYDPPTKTELDSGFSALNDPTAAAIRAEIDSNSTQLAAVVADTNEIQGDWADGGRLDLILDARASQASVDTIDGNVDAILVDTGTTIPATISTAQADLDTITGADGVNLLSATQASVDAIEADTNELQADLADGGRLDLILDSRATQASVDTVDGNVDAILVDTGTTLPATLSTAQADLDIITGADGVNLLSATQASVDAIESDTNELQGDWANAGRLDTILDAVATQASVDAGVDVASINSNSAAAVRLALSAGQIVIGTVDTVTNTHTPTTTELQADDITEATADHYNGRIILFTSGALAGQATAISDYAAVGGIGQFTVVALTEAPSNNDAFIIL